MSLRVCTVTSTHGTRDERLTQRLIQTRPLPKLVPTLVSSTASITHLRALTPSIFYIHPTAASSGDSLSHTDSDQMYPTPTGEIPSRSPPNVERQVTRSRFRQEMWCRHPLFRAVTRAREKDSRLKPTLER